MEMKETILKTFAEVFGDAEGTKAYFAPGSLCVPIALPAGLACP